MRGLFKRRVTQQPGWLAISLQPGELCFAHGIGGERNECAINRCGRAALSDEAQLPKLAEELGLARYQCLALLPPADYQLLMVEAPNVPLVELKTAVRWRIKDMLDYHVQDATVDVLDIPVEAGAGRAHSMYAVAARNDVIHKYIERFATARLALSVIDIAETAQRNIATLLEPPERGVALLYAGRAQALLTINFRGELYQVRRIDVGLTQLEDEQTKVDAMNRLLLELQRSLDHVDRQYPFVSVAKLIVAPTPSETGLRGYLARNLELSVEELRLGEVLRLGDDARLEGDGAWRLFHVLGAALRHEPKAL